MSITFTRSLFLMISLFPAIYSLREQCCKDLGVPENCYETLCNPNAVPKVMKRYRLYDPENSCQSYLLPISQCLSKGRDVSRCCYKHSDDLELSYCFGLCNGTMNYEKTRKSDYLSCFVLNVAAIFPCLTASYSSSPSQPRDLEIASRTESTATLEWKEPADLPELVRTYKIYLIERINMKETKSIFETTETEFLLENLSAESSYSAYVVAFGKEHKNDSEWNKSVYSNIVSFTTAAEIAISKEVIRVPPSAKYVELSCILRRVDGAEGEVDWVKKIEGGSEILQNGTKYSIFTYPSNHDPKTIVSALKIRSLEIQDFANYRCYIKNTRIEYNEVVVLKYIHSEEAPSDNPPETILECCSKGDPEPGCVSVCNGINVEGGRRTHIRPGMYMPTAGCPKEVDKLFKCSIADSGTAACCIHSQVPFNCLGMCDSRFDMRIFKQKTCQNVMKKIYACQLELMNWKPEAISFVKVKHLYGDTYRFSWDTVLDVKVFHIYQRKNKGMWTSRVTIAYAVDITDADEVVLLSVNDFGRSQQHRLSYDENGWFTVDH